MLRSKLKNEYNKSQSTEDLDNYKRQRNFCVNLLRNINRNYFGNLGSEKYIRKVKLQKDHQVLL